MNGGISSPMNESLNHDRAIRRFCPARMEQEEGAEFEETMNEIEFFSFSDDTISTPHLDASEVDELVDSFINVDQDINGNDKSPEKQEAFDHFQTEVETFSVVNDAFADVPMTVEGDEMEMGGLVEDLAAVPDMVPSGEGMSHGADQGLHLVHLLLVCAEAVGCRDTQLAESMLAKIWSTVNQWSDSLQRVSHCFAVGLKARLSLLHNVNANGTFSNDGATDVSMISAEEKMEAFQLLYQTTPYIAFGFMAANEAICQAAQGKDSLHVLGLGMEPLQWPSLIRTLASRPEGPPKLRITGLTNGQNFSDLEATMKALIEDPSSSGIHLEYNIISEPITPSLLTRENLNLMEGEALFVNSIMHLHKFIKESRGSLKAILQEIKKLSPALLTVVEQDANHNGPFFLGRFLESLHYYSAIFDSLEASLPRNSQWRRQLGRSGFQVVGLKCMSQARMMLSVYGCDGYTLASEKGCLLLGWKGRPIMLASAWQVHNATSSSSTLTTCCCSLWIGQQ